MIVGILTRYNKRTVTVIAGTGERWNVAPQFLQRLVEPSDLRVDDANVVPIRKK